MPQITFTSLLLLLLFLGLGQAPAAAQVPDSLAPTRWHSTRASGWGLPLGSFNRASEAGFSSAATVSYRLGEPAGRWWVGTLGFFGTYGFTSAFEQNGFRFELEGEHGVTGGFALLGRELPLAERWSLHLYAGVGGARIGSSELTVDVNTRRVTARNNGGLFAGLLAGGRLEYAFRPRIRPFVSLMRMTYPMTRFGETRMVLGIPQVGYSVPLGRRIKSPVQ